MTYLCNFALPKRVPGQERYLFVIIKVYIICPIPG